MFLRNAAVAVGLLAISGGAALANPATDALTRQWNYTAPHNPDASLPNAATRASNQCPEGTSSATGTTGQYCAGMPRGQFVQVSEVPDGYQGRVFRVHPLNGSGYQDLGW
ncbi:hypothetical protein [Actibacterium sp. XHP0104]|uniref:hypothetical protein n=1 Tax=Actibacterium sp. XHP0104 TaxID=2984335 RepID=UPI0021E980A1|nr:hypothetical protein [Actibacterium sp. XHP0104]MCV2881280.1 hypothetical protein [Actibacterium sp. XHP0104]